MRERRDGARTDGGTERNGTVKKETTSLEEQEAQKIFFKNTQAELIEKEADAAQDFDMAKA